MFVNLAQIAQGAERIRPVRLDEDAVEVEVTLSAAQLAQREAHLRAAHAAIEGEAAPRRGRSVQTSPAGSTGSQRAEPTTGDRYALPTPTVARLGKS